MLEYPKHVVGLRLLPSYGESKTGDICLYPPQKEDCENSSLC